MSIEVESPEKNSSPPSPSPSFSSLPDEIALTCLARISSWYYPTLSFVSKSFKSLISSNELYAARSHLGNTEQCLYIRMWNYNNYRVSQWFRLWINPNHTLPYSKMVPIPSSNDPYRAFPTVAVVGSEIYVIGGRVNGRLSSAVNVLNCRSHTWRDAPSMNAARESSISRVCNGNIYVMGGVARESWDEKFDTKTQTWKCFHNTYHTKQGKWESCGSNVDPGSKRDDDEVWGNVEWVNVMRTVDRSCSIFNCVVVSV